MKESSSIHSSLLNRWVMGGAVLLALLMTLYQLSSVFLSWDYIRQQDLHLGFALILVFLHQLARSKCWRSRVALSILAAASGMVCTYIFHFADDLAVRAGFINSTDIAIGIMLTVVVLIGSHLSWGPVFLVVVGGSIAYLFLGHLVPPPLDHPEMSFPLMISLLGVGISGIFGNLLSASNNYIFLYILFGMLMMTCGGTRSFIEVGKLAGRLLAGGPGQTAVIGSAFVGMVTGAAMANVAITGAFTIPLMKRVGYRPVDAAAIEAAASTGGQLLPPIMGSAVFIMAALIGVPYVEIMIASTIPALLFFLAVAFSVQAKAKKSGITVPHEPVNKTVLIRSGLVFLVPLAILVGLLLMRYSTRYAGFFAIVSVLLISLIQEQTRPSVRQLVDGVFEAAVMASKVAVAVAAIGMLVAVVTTTGLGSKFTGLVEVAAGGNVWLLLLLTAIVSLVLGIGLPTVAAYTLVAVIVVPAIIRAGAPVLPAHLFAFFFAVMAHVTPPVATSALAAAPIAGAPYFATALQAFRVCLPSFTVPFLFVFNPILLFGTTDLYWGLVSLVAAPVLMFCFVGVLEGFLFVRASAVERVLLAVVCAGLALFIINGSTVALVLGLTFLAVVLFRQLVERRAHERTANQTVSTS